MTCIIQRHLMSHVRYKCVDMPFTLFCEMPGNDHLTFVPAVELVALHVLQNIWFQHDGTPPHLTRAVLGHLDQRLGQTWIDRGGPIA